MLFTNRSMRALLFAIAGVGLYAQPTLRLSGDVRPLKHVAELTLRPGAESFSGKIEIDVDIRKPSALIWLNATELSISEATVEAAATKQTATVDSDGSDFVGLRLAAPLPMGPATLRLVYTGKISAKNSRGIFQGREGKEDYLFTQFAAIDARRAFPCFDQPDLKTSWQLTLQIPKEHTAASNTPQLSETSAADGMKKIVFAPTKLLSSYLVAFAVGPFDVVDGGKAGKQKVPVRFFTPKGKAGQAKFAAEVTATLVDRLETYFRIPYPFEKLDSVAGPRLAGAMENAGLITYDQTWMLSEPELDTPQRQRRYAMVAAHEVAHQWFGNSVTMKWWDDLWLNEAFATWTASKIIAEWKPEWNTRTSDLRGKFGAMTSDSQVSTRQIRQPIESKDDISNAFDSITYQKGSAVIRMFESWVGESTFQNGVNTYLKRYASSNAGAGDFLDAVASSGQPRLTAAISTFLQQPGVPLITVDLKCDGAPKVVLSQKRYLPIGSVGASNQIWQVPVCIGYRVAGTVTKECFLLDKPSAEFGLAKATSCPDYISGNDQAAGYYVTAYSPSLLRKLLAPGMTTRMNGAERRTLLKDINSLTKSGDIPIGEALNTVKAMSSDPDWNVVGYATTMISREVQDLVPASLGANYSRFISASLGASAAKLGWSASPGEDEERSLVRPQVVELVAKVGTDPALAAEARRLADAWLEHRRGVDPSMLSAVLNTAAYFGGRPFFDRLLRELEKVEDRRQREIMINSLSASRDPEVVQAALDLILNSSLDGRQSLSILLGPLANPETKRLPFEFVKKNYEKVIERMPSVGSDDLRAILPMVGAALCDADSRKEFVAVFEQNANKFVGGPRIYRQALERIRLCEERKAAQGADFAAYVATQ